ncbi:TonB-dependent receptor [Ancylomarina longa]|uniref:TonB-dependent receptor n=1 Tax=Ancylomarina longa TaxID=2487017 RepID=A0A434AXB7_9BACT|nr:TonB-dependent receptor [Ancylomarina longa]RUT79172.1 TonB-dependent receptor [Ancylomarina longa]
MKKTIVTTFALLSILNFTLKAEENRETVTDSTAVKHLNLSEVQVNASRVNAKMKDLPQKVDVISRRVIEASPAADMAGLLKASSSVDIQQYPGVNAGIGIRGFSASTSSKYAVILINGKPAGTKNIATIDLNNVERVEILKGPFSAQYGSAAMGGVVNIVTKESTGDIAGAVDLQYGSFQTSKANMNVGGALSDVFDFDFAYSYYNQAKDYKVGDHNFYDEDYAKTILDVSTYGERMENSQLLKQNFDARLGIKLSENWKINYNASYFLADDVEAPGTFWHIYGMNKKDLDKFSTGMDVLGQIGNHKLTISPFYSKENSDFFSKDMDANYYQSSENVFKNYGFLINDAIAIGKHTFALGIDNNTEKYESTLWGNSGDEAAPYLPNYSHSATGIFGQIHFKLFNDKLNASVGTRFDQIAFKINENQFLNAKSKTENYSVLTENIGLKYDLGLGLAAHASWGNAFLAPDAYQVAGSFSTIYATTKGNPNLDPEKSNTFDLGFAYKDFKKGINFDLTYFQTHHKDKIVTESIDPDGTPYNGDEYNTYMNANKADMNGLEVVASYDFGALSDYDYSLRVYLNYTHLFDATVETKSGNEYLESQMKYVRDNTASFGIEFDNLKGFTTRLNGRYIGHRYEDNWITTWAKTPINFKGADVRPDLLNESVLRHPVSYVFDYSANYTFKEKYSVGITISNLLDENYTEKDGYNMPGRAVIAKIGYRF